MPDQSGATRAVIDFITGARWPEFPQDAIDIGKRCIIDGLGVMLGGSVAVASAIAFMRAAGGAESPQDATDIGNLCIIGALGVMLAGAVTDASRIACDYTR